MHSPIVGDHSCHVEERCWYTCGWESDIRFAVDHGKGNCYGNQLISGANIEK